MSWINMMINASIIHGEVHLSEQKQERSFDWFQMKRALSNSEKKTIAVKFLGKRFLLKKDLNDLCNRTESIHTSIKYLKHSNEGKEQGFKCSGTFLLQLNIFYTISVRENRKNNWECGEN